MKKVLTLCLVVRGDEVLLGMKKRGFGVGRWNGFGGKVENGESVLEGAKRELKEEVGISPVQIEEVGVFNFVYNSDSTEMEVHLFKVSEFHGEPNESEEMLPKWFKFDEVPFSEMWPDDKFWFPLFAKGEKFRGKFVFDMPSTKEYTSQILSSELKVVDYI